MNTMSRAVIIMCALLLMVIGSVVSAGTTSATADKFKIAVLPDTQAELNRPDMPNVSGQDGQGFYDEVQWIKKYAAKFNIVAVVGVGDVVGNAECQDQWNAAVKTYDELLATGLPVLIGTGNHDVIRYRSSDLPAGCQQITHDSRSHNAPGTGNQNDNDWVKSTDFDNNFPLAKFSSKSYFGGSMSGSESASYDLFSASGINFLAITLPFGPTANELSWAKSVASHYPQRHVLYATHDYLGDDNQLRGNRHNLLGYGDFSSSNLVTFNASPCVKHGWYVSRGADGTYYCSVEHALANHAGGTPMPGAKNGIDMYSAFVDQSPNVQYVVSGHIVKPEEMVNGVPHKRAAPTPFVLQGYLRSNTASGSAVNQMVFNAQTATDGGGGYMRLLTFQPSEDTVTVSTPEIGANTGMSPSHLTDPDDAFTISNDVLAKNDAHPFWDVSDASPFVSDIYTIRKLGITNGYADNTFHPSETIDRQAAAEFTFRSLKVFQSGQVSDHPSCSQGGINNQFNDVADDSPFCYAINYMAGNGIVSGYTDGGFHPSAMASRQSYAVWTASIICKRKGLPVSSCRAAPTGTEAFSDVPPSHPFYGSIMYLRHAGITNGYSDNTFRPADYMSRQAAAVFTARAIDYAP